jgi:transmembrane sensor
VNAAVDPESPIGRAGRAWALAALGGDFSPEQSERLRVWLAADPRHGQAYEQAEDVILAVGDLYGAAEPRAVSVPGATTAPTRRSPAIAATAAGLLAASVVAVTIIATTPQTYETSPGQTRQIALSDGSRVTLAPGSKLRGASRWRPRALALDRGEAFFAVAPDEGHPFTVESGPTLVQVLGTRFNVHAGPSGQVRVEVEQGVVRVGARQGPADASVTLRAGQQVVTDGRDRFVAPLSIPAGDWRRGRLAYEDAALSEIVADLNRYRRRQIRLESPDVGRLKLTTAFDVEAADRFVLKLPQVLPVRLRSDGRDGEVLEARPPSGRIGG